MTEFQPPYCVEAEGEKHPAQLFRQAISSLLESTGGVVQAGALDLSAHAPANMSVDVLGGAPPLGEIWVPGSSAPGTQAMYFCWNDGVVNRPIAAASEASPRIDTVIARVFDSEYAGAEDGWAIEVLTGKPEAGATLENLKGAAELPDSSLVLGYVLVPAKATKIEAADLLTVVPLLEIKSELLPAPPPVLTGDYVTHEIINMVEAKEGSFTPSMTEYTEVNVKLYSSAVGEPGTEDGFTDVYVNGHFAGGLWPTRSASPFRYDCINVVCAPGEAITVKSPSLSCYQFQCHSRILTKGG